MQIEFTNFPKDSNWVSGIVIDDFGGEYKFEAKLFDEGSSFGINGGRVSKLGILRGAEMENKFSDYFERAIVNYDRGWDIHPQDGDEDSVFHTVLEFLENAPIRFA